MSLFRDTAILFNRSLTATLRSPLWALLGLFQPLLYLLLFAPLLESYMGADSLPTFIPGLLVMMALYGALASGYTLLIELRGGVVERFRVTTVNRAALLLGPVLRDALILIVQCALLIGLATLMGLRVGIVPLLLSFVLVALVGMAMAALIYGLALSIKDENGLASITNTFALPILLLSGILLPLTAAPTVLKTMAAVNPFSHFVDAVRDLFANDIGSGGVLLGFGLATALAFLCCAWAIRLYRTAVA